LNNFFIKKILFETEGFLYIFDNAAIKFLVIFSLETLNAIIDARDNQITDRAHSMSYISFSFWAFPREEDKNLSGTGSLQSASFKTRSSHR